MTYRKRESFRRGDEQECSTCFEWLPLTSYYHKPSRGTKNDGYEYRCKACCSQRSTQKNAATQVRIAAIKDVPCMDCGIKYPPYVMDFDHVRGDKKFNISQVLSRNWQSILEEIAKCEIVCANCHRIRTHSADPVTEPTE